ncbi:MAG: SPOR domain-containing protein [Colwellia sp.]|nr:SPOR domain-containing protein [Colwellia sp.]
MSTPFQNRLVGTIIVSAAIVIFLPDILDGEKQSYQADFEAIPSAPVFEQTQEDKSFPAEKLKKLPVVTISDEKALDAVKPADDIIKHNTNDLKIAVLTKDKPVIEKKSVAVTNQVNTKRKVVTTTVKTPEKAVVDRAWVIHLGSFRHKQNVKELLAKLKQNGYVAFTKPIKTKNGTLTKVFIGPELIKSSLEKKLSKLKVLTGVQGKVARYYANK